MDPFDRAGSLLPEDSSLYQKGMEIFDLVNEVADLIPEEDRMISDIKNFMRESASLMVIKVTGAYSVDLYDLKMENAVIIRKAGRDLLAQCSGLKMMDFQYPQYLQLIRDAVDEYRVLFAEWVKTFDPQDYVIDRWGLFNPPGVNYDDHDPDDDIPFDKNDNFDDED